MADVMATPREVIVITDSDNEDESFKLARGNAPTSMKRVVKAEDHDRELAELSKWAFVEEVDFSQFLDNPPFNSGRQPATEGALKNMPVDSSSNVGLNVTQDLETLYPQFQAKVLEVFPDLDLDYLRKRFDTQCRTPEGKALVTTVELVSHDVIAEILDSESYPKQIPKGKSRKRKRSASEDDSTRKWASPNRTAATMQERQEMRLVLLREFPSVPLQFIDKQIKTHRNVWQTFEALAAAVKVSDERNPPFKKLKKLRDASVGRIFTSDYLQHELVAVRDKRHHEEALQAEIKLAAEIEAALEKKALEEGDVVECQCCFSDTPTAKSTHCSNDPCHSFCIECAKGSAKAQIEKQRYDLPCMDSSGCQAEFSHTEKIRFLDSGSQAILDRLQQQDVLRVANIEGLEECPRCDYAEIYPPVEVNRIFECKNEECDAFTICRLCKKDSHVPKTCAEYKKELGLAERNTVAEAMTEALIRKCPKCSVPIIKESGCNKMTCTKCGVHFCDVCKKDITKESYNHFRLGGPCQQVDNHYARDQQRIKDAEKVAKAKVLAENPDLKEEDLKFKFSEDELKYPRDSIADPAEIITVRVDAPHRRLGAPYQRVPRHGLQRLEGREEELFEQRLAFTRQQKQQHQVIRQHMGTDEGRERHHEPNQQVAPEGRLGLRDLEQDMRDMRQYLEVATPRQEHVQMDQDVQGLFDGLRKLAAQGRLAHRQQDQPAYNVHQRDLPESIEVRTMWTARHDIEQRYREQFEERRRSRATRPLFIPHPPNPLPVVGLDLAPPVAGQHFVQRHLGREHNPQNLFLGAPTYDPLNDINPFRFEFGQADQARPAVPTRATDTHRLVPASGQVAGVLAPVVRPAAPAVVRQNYGTPNFVRGTASTPTRRTDN